MSNMATEIVGLKEFLFRRKIGRTTLFDKIKRGELIEGIDFIRDGKLLNFFWPTRELFVRDLKLLKMYGDISTIDDKMRIDVSPSKSISPAEARIKMQSIASKELVKEKPSRLSMPVPSKNNTSIKRAAFDIS